MAEKMGPGQPAAARRQALTLMDAAAARIRHLLQQRQQWPVLHSQLRRRTMLGSTMVSFKKLAKKVKVLARAPQKPSQHYFLLKEFEEDSLSFKTPTGFFALYVGENHQRFVVPTSFLSHPLFKMLLEKSYSEFGFEQSTGLVVPCSVSTFKEV